MQPLGKRKRDGEVAASPDAKPAPTDKKKKRAADGTAVAVAGGRGGGGGGDEHGSIREGDDAQKHSIFVQNLPKNATDEIVSALFGDCGSIVGVRVVKDKFGNAKGFAYIDFESEEGVSNALEPVEGGRKLGGRTIEVSKSRPLSRPAPHIRPIFKRGSKNPETVIDNGVAFSLTIPMSTAAQREAEEIPTTARRST